MSELHKARVTDVSEAQKIALSNEVFVKEQLKQALEEHQLNSKRMQSDLITQVIIYGSHLLVFSDKGRTFEFV